MMAIIIYYHDYDIVYRTISSKPSRNGMTLREMTKHSANRKLINISLQLFQIYKLEQVISKEASASS